MNYYVAVLKKYAVFTGRAGRAEYWYFVLFNIIIMAVLNVLTTSMKDVAGLGMLFSLVASLYSLAVLIPSIAVAVRRLHDTSKSGWLLLLCLIPVIGWIVLLVFMIMDSTPGANAYGPNPKGSASPIPAAPVK